MRITRMSITRRLRRHFVAGLLVLVPILITLWIVQWLFRIISGVLARPTALLLGGNLEDPLPLIGGLGVTFGHLVPFISTILLLAVIVGTGALARNIAGAQAVSAGERIVARIPVIRRIYLAVSQISEALFSDQRGVFRKAVLFEYPRKGIWSVGFVTAESDPAGLAPPGPHYHVFLPTTPNPTSGYLLMVPIPECIDLGMSIEDALKLIISGGAVTPASENPPSEEGSTDGAAT